VPLKAHPKGKYVPEVIRTSTGEEVARNCGAEDVKIDQAHLGFEEVQQLIVYLQRWVDTGEFTERPKGGQK